MEKPIATYEEARFELRRRFALFPDRIRVTGKGLYLGRLDAVIPLSILHPDPARQWVRGQLFRYGLFALFVAACWAASLSLGGGPEALVRPWVVGVLGSLALVGLLVVLANIRPVEFARFQTDAGVIALDVGRVGRQAEGFDEFVDLLIEQIQGARPTA